MANTVTLNFSMDRQIYNEYKGVVRESGQNVKGNLINYMKSVIKYGIPNADTLDAIAEVQALKMDPNKKTYNSFAEILEELEAEDA